MKSHRPHENGPRLFKRRGVWVADLRYLGEGRVTLRDPAAAGWPASGRTTDDVEEAEAWRWEYVRFLTGEVPEYVPYPLSLAIRQYLKHRQREGLTPGTITGDESTLGLALKHFGDVDAYALTESDWCDWIDGRGIMPSTANTQAMRVAAFLAWLTGEPSDIAAHYPRRHVEEEAVFLTDHERQRLRDHADACDRSRQGTPEVFRLFVEAGLSMGLRLGELAALRWEDIDKAERVVFVRRQFTRESPKAPRQLKGKRARVALVLPNWWEYHRDGSGYVFGDPMGRTRIQALSDRLFDAIPRRVGAHSLRHCYARDYLTEHGGSLMELRDYLGHKSVTTTERAYGFLAVGITARMGRSRVYG